jgi:hypothetical protein
MPITVKTVRTAAFFKTVTVLATKQLKVLIDGIEDTSFTLTAPADDSLDVTLTITAKGELP